MSGIRNQRAHIEPRMETMTHDKKTMENNGKDRAPINTHIEPQMETMTHHRETIENNGKSKEDQAPPHIRGPLENKGKSIRKQKRTQ